MSCHCSILHWMVDLPLQRRILVLYACRFPGNLLVLCQSGRIWLRVVSCSFLPGCMLFGLVLVRRMLIRLLLYLLLIVMIRFHMLGRIRFWVYFCLVWLFLQVLLKLLVVCRILLPFFLHLMQIGLSGIRMHHRVCLSCLFLIWNRCH